MILKIHLETQIEILGIAWPIRSVGHVELGAHMKGRGLLATLQTMWFRCGSYRGHNLSLKGSPVEPTSSDCILKWGWVKTLVPSEPQNSW